MFACKSAHEHFFPAHLSYIANYSPPVDTELVEMVMAEYDAYQPGYGY